MFREMRRKKQLLSKRESIDVLSRGTAGVLALLGDDDYPYAVPISYVYDNSKIYFHGAKAGHKIDAIQKWVLSEHWVWQEKVDTKVSAFSLSNSFSYLGIYSIIELSKDERR